MGERAGRLAGFDGRKEDVQLTALDQPDRSWTVEGEYASDANGFACDDGTALMTRPRMSRRPDTG